MTEQCCPPFEPEKWQNQTFVWENKKFIRDKVFCMFFMPLGFGVTMKRVMAKLNRASAKAEDWMCLSEHTSRWNMDVYVATDRDVPDAEMCELNGRFFSRVYEGGFGETGKWCKDFDEHTKREGMSIGKSYMWYTTCPKCAKKYGKNYVVILGQLS